MLENNISAVHNKMIVMFPAFIHLVKLMDKRYILAGNINDITFELKNELC